MSRSHALLGVVAAVAVAAAAGVATRPAAAEASDASVAVGGSGNILYLKAGKLWRASANGRVKRRVPHAGRFVSASQSDNGTIAAHRGLEFYRLSRAGKLLNKPITTAFRTSKVLPAFNGPFSPEISPDGTKIAYTYSFIASHYDYRCQCNRISPSMNTSYTWSNRFTESPDKTFGSISFHYNASWIDNRTTLSTTQHLFDYGGNVMDALGTDRVGGGLNSYKNWFSGCMSGCDSVDTLQLYRYDEAEMTRQKDKVVVVSGPLNGDADGSTMQIHRMTGLPPAVPPTFCQIAATSGKLSSPTWSPDGTSLAWADAKGIWVGKVGATYGPEGPACALTKRLVIPGGSKPDWGPAKP